MYDITDPTEIAAFEAFKATFSLDDVSAFRDAYLSHWPSARAYYKKWLATNLGGDADDLFEWLDPFLNWDELIAERIAEDHMKFVPAKDGGVFVFYTTDLP